MRPAQRIDSATQTQPHGSRQYREDDDVMDDATVLAHLEADFMPDSEGDPITGLAVAISVGTALWLVLLTVFVWL